MKYTTNLSLKKPDYTDPVDVQDINDNMDAIDTAIGEHKAESVAQAGGIHGLEVESGIWTPAIAGEETQGNINISENVSSYKKINNLIICNFRIKFTLTGATGMAIFKGLPFIPKNEGQSGYISYATIFGGTVFNHKSMVTTANNDYFRIINGNGGYLQVSEYVDRNILLIGNIIYEI